MIKINIIDIINTESLFKLICEIILEIAINLQEMSDYFFQHDMVILQMITAFMSTPFAVIWTFYCEVYFPPLG